ncbi:MAG: carbamate kinase [Turicibacter sp.]|nr:carbamate kinase [Turicibacter sp.]
MGKRVVLALGGNALGDNLAEQMLAVRDAASALVDLVEEGYEIVIVHGNGPQVGMINLAMEAAAKTPEDYIPMATCVAMSQGYIGYDIQNALREELLKRGINKPVATIITQTLVDDKDPAFSNPTKPIGGFFSKEEAEKLRAQGEAVMEDAGRGWRRVIASPKPIGIVEYEIIESMLKMGQIPVTVGGGGIPVAKDGEYRLCGMSAVVDKDFASAKLAELLDADMLVILTAVEKVAINFGKSNEEWLSALTIEQAKAYIAEEHFAKGSMLPKVEAAMAFAQTKPGRKALITLLSKAKDGLAGKTGTVISQ